jgi:hypothetical protein
MAEKFGRTINVDIRDSTPEGTPFEPVKATWDATRVNRSPTITPVRRRTPSPAAASTAWPSM